MQKIIIASKINIGDKFIFICIINILIKEFYNYKFNNCKYHFSNITLKLKGIGNKNILSNYFNEANYPYEISINGIKQNEVSYHYNFNKTDNYVELSWNNNIINCENMFRGCSSIYEINFPNFDTSQVKTMKKMFLDCTLLTSLNLSKFDTSNVEDMSNMFFNCKLITSLNLSNFNTLKVSNMDDLFDDCKNLIYINLENFHKIVLINKVNIFDNIPDNIFACGNVNKIYNHIKINKKCYTIDCSDDIGNKNEKE